MIEFLERLFLPAILLTFAFMIAFCEPAKGDEARSLPVKKTHTVVVYDVAGLRCVTYVNNTGVSHGSSSTACVPVWTTRSNEYRAGDQTQAPLKIIGVYENE